ncbi:MBL fold metallo-hydrolase [Castellaniella caeni]|uniref:MBL fold metallo-hydrolase n=1 Tax=Castellaniella caeni TaxID=266123 RepID=UPI000AF100D9|nr:MBL fold metallo-hydrolase [Castellaniella caeni]
MNTTPRIPALAPLAQWLRAASLPLAGAALLALAAGPVLAASSDAASAKTVAAAPAAAVATPYVQLLGTKGGPSLLTPKALPQSSAIVTPDGIIVVDAGYGASYRLVQSKLKLRDIRAIYITHLHSDHVVDYPALLMNAWATGLKHPIAVYGPKGTKAMTEYTWKAFEDDIEKRIKDEGKPDPRKLVTVTEIDEGPIDTQGASVQAAALRVWHPPFADGEAYAYRFKTGGRTIVFTGDLHEFPKGFSQFAQQADLLVSEAAEPAALENLAKRVGNGDKNFAKAILSHHVTTEQVGQAAAQAKVKQVVISHLVPADDPSITDQDWINGVAKAYHGPVTVGHDLMRIDFAQ